MAAGRRQVEHDGRELVVVANDLGSFTILHGRPEAITRFNVSRKLAWRMAWWLIYRCMWWPRRDKLGS